MKIKDECTFCGAQFEIDSIISNNNNTNAETVSAYRSWLDAHTSCRTPSKRTDRELQ